MPGVLVLAADTLVRFKGGRILIHTTTSPLPAFESEQPMLIGWLCQFARPLDGDAALASLSATDRSRLEPVVDYLVKCGALVPAGSAASTESESAAATERSGQHLQLLARSVYDLGCDLLAFGPFAEREIGARSGVGVERRLMALLAAIDSLRGEFHGLREPYLLGQLGSLGVAPTDRELKLHVGCGRNVISGWINVDVYPAPLATNVLWGLPLVTGSIRYAFVSHLLEHLYYPRDVRPFLAELRRVIAPGGVVRIVVPDVEQCITAYQNHDAAFFASRRETWSWWPENPTRLEDFLAYAGAGPEPAYLFESHKYGYDFETLARTLTEAGFVAVIRSEFMQSSHAPLRVDEASAVAKAKYGNRYYSLFVEAESP
jgi:SAM-dependent methyltransferase